MKNIVRPEAGVFVRMAAGAALAFCFASSAYAQVAGTKNIPGDYADLAAAITDVNTNGVGPGGATLNVTAAQTAPVGGYTIATTTASVANPLVLVGNANIITANPALVAAAINDAIIKIVGTDNVTISGFTLQENVGNTTTATLTNNMTEFGIALFYATPTDNAQNITLQNNTISLNRASNNTFGIYANATHTAAAVTTTASGTGVTGGNSGLKIYGNTINNVNNGIVIVGPTAAADANDGVDVGGASAATGNTLTNYGTTGIFSGFANVATSSVNGVLIRNSKNFNVSFNGITSSTATTIPTATNTGTVRGIYIPAASSAPLGSIVNSLNNNTIGLRGGATSVILRGVDVETTSGNITTTVNINNNNFVDASFNPAASTGPTTFISNLGAVLNANINNNRFDNLTINSGGAVNFITNGFNLPAGGVKNVNDNLIVTQFTKSIAGGTVSLYTDNASSVSGSSANNLNNNFSNITVTGSTGQAGWSNTDGVVGTASTFTKTVTGNIFTNWTNGGGASTSNITPLIVNFGGTLVVSNNTISGMTAGTGTITGLTVGSGGAQTVSNNTVRTFSSAGTQTGITTSASVTATFSLNTVNGFNGTGANNITGMTCASGTTVTFAQNKIFSLSNSNVSGAVFGITASGGITANINNNIIGDLTLPNSGANVSLVGLNITGGTTVNASFNTVRLAATSSGLNFGSVAVLASSTPTVNLRNNNLVNLSTANGIGLTIAYRRSSTTLTSYGLVSNNNNFYAGTPSATNVIFTDTVNIDQTLAAFKSRLITRDGASVTEGPLFASTTGSAATFLHINPATPSQLESSGVTVSGIIDDFDGEVRNVLTPDIGADEFAGVFLDLVPPTIVYATLANTSLLANRTIPVTVSDASGVASGTNAPRVYFRKAAGSYVSAPCTGSAPAVSCVINHGLLGGVAIGDVVSYFVIAQDLFSPTNVGTNPSAGFVGADVNTVTTPPTAPNTYTIVATLPTALNVGTGETITSLTNANGLFAALNAGVLSANTVVTLTSDLIVETGAVVLNPPNEELGAFNLTIQPNGARQVIGASTSTTPLIDINGADRVTFDGLNTAGNTLLIRNTAQGVIRYINDASNNVLRNVTLEGTAGFTVVNVSTGITTGNDNIQIVSNTIRDRSDIVSVPFNLIGSFATTPTISNSNLLIDSNILINFTSTGVVVNSGTDNITVTRNNISQTAIRAASITGVSVNACFGTNVFSRNVIRDFSASGASIMTGMTFADARDTLVSRNRIFNFNNIAAATGAINGIGFNGGTGTPSASITIVNNMITLSPTVSTNQIIRGIFDFGFVGNTFTADYNSIYIGGVNSGTASSWALIRRDLADTFFTARNNIAFNNRTGGSGNNFAGGDSSANTGTFVSNYNFFAGTGAIAANFMDYGTVASGTPVSFATYQAGPPTRDANSIAGVASSFVPTDIFVDFANGDLHVKATAPSVLNAGTPVGTTSDFDNDPRSATAPEIGADELPVPNTAPTIIPASGVTRQQGTAVSNSTIATVSDAEQAVGTLIVTAPTVPAGLTVNSIANTAGTASANIVAACTATLGANTVGLSVSDGLLNTAGNLSVNVTANSAPVLGTYPVGSATTGFGSTVTPGAAPTDNGSVDTLTAAAPGFTGTFAGNPTTGVITVSNAGPAGSYTVTVTATDNCTTTNTATFTLTVTNANTAPSITPAGGVTRQQGSAVSNSTIATVSDAEQIAGSLSVTAPTVPAGLTLSTIANAAGTVSANVVAACTATVGANTVGLSVTDGLLSTAGNLSVNVTANTPPVVSAYGTVSATTGSGTTATPVAVPTDNGTVTSLTANAPGFTGMLNGNASSGVITIGNAGPAGTYTVTVTATDNCNTTNTVTFTLNVSNANTAPTITPAVSVTRQQGSAVSNSTIATVADAESSAGSLTVTAPVVPAGLTVSNIANTAGTASADILAACTASLGANTVGLSVSDSLLSTTGNLSVNVTANGAPVLGTYGTTTATTGGNTTVTPSAAPSDNGSVATLTATAPGFTGTLTGNATTGVISAGNAGPSGSFTVTVTATDNCNTTSTTTFTLNVSNANTAPTITPAPGVARQQGSAASSSTIAVVSDAESSAGSLTVTAPTVPAGLTVASLANSTGTVSASVAAACAATIGTNTVVLNVSDGSLNTNGNLSVNVTANSAPVLGTYAPTTVASAGSISVPPSAAPTDNGVVATLTASAPGFTGTLMGNPATGVISVSGAAPPSATAYVVTVTATDNCGLSSTRTFNLTVINTANLDVSKNDGVSTYRPGDLLVYTIVLRNLGPDAANGVVFTDTIPASLINANWTCAAANGAACPQTSGSGSINATVANLPATGRLTYTLQANVATPTPAQVVNTAQVSLGALPISDPNLTNNSATDIDLSELIFSNGFEDALRLINKANGQQSLNLVSLAGVLDNTARIVFSAQDSLGEALRVYGRSSDAGEVELAIAVRGNDGLLRLGAWQRFNSSEARFNYVALSGTDGFVLQSARFE
jgi:hypothetical protein